MIIQSWIFEPQPNISKMFTNKSFCPHKPAQTCYPPSGSFYPFVTYPKKRIFSTKKPGSLHYRKSSILLYICIVWSPQMGEFNDICQKISRPEAWHHQWNGVEVQECYSLDQRSANTNPNGSDKNGGEPSDPSWGLTVQGTKENQYLWIRIGYEWIPKSDVFSLFVNSFRFFFGLFLGIYMLNFRRGISRWIWKLVIHQSAQLRIIKGITVRDCHLLIFFRTRCGFRTLMVAPSLSKKISSSVAAVPTGYDTSFWSTQLRWIHVKFAMFFALLNFWWIWWFWNSSFIYPSN